MDCRERTEEGNWSRWGGGMNMQIAPAKEDFDWRPEPRRKGTAEEFRRQGARKVGAWLG